MNFCGQCGAAREPGARFCVQCGSPLGGSVGPGGNPVGVPDTSPQEMWARLQTFWWNSGNFNVESGNGAVKTQYFPYCECHLDPAMIGVWSCPECGRTSATSLTFPTGHGDGVYPVFTLEDSAGHPSGAIACFTQKWAIGLDDKSLSPSQITSEASPIWVGTVRADGRLLFSEAGAGRDDSDVTVDVAIQDEPHDVIAWIGEVPTLVSAGISPSRRPIAFGVYRPDLASALAGITHVERSPDAWAIYRPWNTMTWQVMSHRAPQWSLAARLNHDEDMRRGSRDRALSWLLQAALHGDESARAELGNTWGSVDPATTAHRRQLMEWRGQFA